MTTRVTNLNTVKAEKAGDARLWTVLDCLKETIREIEEGEINPSQVLVIMLDFIDEGKRWQHRWRAAGLKARDQMALLEIHRAEFWEHRFKGD